MTFQLTRPKITVKMAMELDLVVTMGCNAQGICPCPFFKPTIDWALEDPKANPSKKVRKIRDEIERRVKQLITQDGNVGL